jgi:hypothetical protein
VKKKITAEAQRRREKNRFYLFISVILARSALKRR